jgi:cytosine deaminase
MDTTPHHSPTAGDLVPKSTALSLSDFQALGDFAPAGLRATELALERAERSASQGRVPIAGAAVAMAEDGTLTIVTVGNNGRIPAPDDAGPGYPTDHGETAAIRAVGDVTAVDWHRVVFATTLSPCIMCTRTLIHLYHLGLTRFVVAESRSFSGHQDMLAALPGVVVVELTNAGAVSMMGRFARTWPWDWTADIGEIPPADLGWVSRLGADRAAQTRLLDEVASTDGTGATAGVVDSTGAIVARSSDQRHRHGNNPTMSAPMIAMGLAGSTVNLRECVLVLAGGEANQSLTVKAFGESSLGACELFRPAALLTDQAVDPALAEALDRAGVLILTTG